MNYRLLLALAAFVLLSAPGASVYAQASRDGAAQDVQDAREDRSAETPAAQSTADAETDDNMFMLEPEGNEKSATLGRAAQNEPRGRLAAPDDAQQQELLVALHWLIPEAKVSRYTLRYGTAPDELEHEAQIEAAALESGVDKVHGPVFRYAVPVKPEAEAVFYTLQAHNEHGSSPPTPVQKQRVKSLLAESQAAEQTAQQIREAAVEERKAPAASKRLLKLEADDS